MAKYNLFLGTAKGKVGDVVMYRLYGQQCSRVRVREIENPKTEAQQVQRSIAATVTQAYSYLKSVCNHSWENISYKGRSMSYFNKVNMDLVRSLYAQNQEEDDTVSVAVTAPSVSTFVPNAYKISKGSLTNPLHISALNEQRTAEFDSISSVTSLTADSTVDDFFSALGLSDINSMYTLVLGATSKNTTLYTYEANRLGAFLQKGTVDISRAVRNDTTISTSDAETALSSADFDTLFSTYFKTNTNSDNMKAVLKAVFNGVVNSEDINVNFEDDITISDYNVKCAAIIRSKYDDTDGWARSTEQMALYNYEEDYGLIPYFGKLAWTQGTEQIGDSDYLLNASEDE